jgi:hypothetical protein
MRLGRCRSVQDGGRGKRRPLGADLWALAAAGASMESTCSHAPAAELYEAAMLCMLSFSASSFCCSSQNRYTASERNAAWSMSACEQQSRRCGFNDQQAVFKPPRRKT